MRVSPRHSQGREFYDDCYGDVSEGSEGDSAINGNMTFLSDNFCGREQEIQDLLELFHQGLSLSHQKQNGEETRVNANLPIVMVSGRSGSGKSRLVEHVLQLLQEEHGSGNCKPFYLLSGKFGEIEGDPYSALVEAFNMLGTLLADGIVDEVEQAQVRNSIAVALGEELGALLSFIPGLSQIISLDGKSKHPGISPENGQNQLQYMFQQLVKAVCSDKKPIILFLDDLQWIDEDSLDLLLSLIKDENMENFIVVGAYRSNEVGEDHILPKGLRQLDEQGKQVVTVPLANWSISDVESFVSQTLALDLDDDTRTLAEAIYGKTRGNALFIRQAMEELHRKEFLFYSRISFRWEWNEKGLEQLEAGISDDVLKSIVAKINHLPKQLQRALVMASYTRSTFDKGALLLLLKANKEDIEAEGLTNLLEVAVLEGILSNQVGSRYYKFRHDSFQEAARSLIPRGPEQDKVKHLIGLKLYEIVSTKNPAAEDWMMYVAADYLNSITLTSPEEWVFRAKVNMDCGKKAFLVAAFLPASRYYQTGVDAIRKIPEHWESQYDLSVRLFRGLSAVALALGMFTTGHEYGKALLDNAKSIPDKIPTYMSMAVALGREERHLESLELSQAALSLLGGGVRRGGTFRDWRDLSSVHKYWKKHTDKEILSLPIMSTKAILVQMALYYQVSLRSSVCGKRDVWLSTLLPQLQLTTQHGLSGFTPMVFAFYSMYLISVGELANAERPSALARAILSHSKDKRQEGLTRYMLGSYVDSWTSSPESVLADMETGYKVASEVGDIETVFCNWGGIGFVSFVAGYPLDKLERSGRERIDQMKLYNEISMLHVFGAMRYPTLALTGRLPGNGAIEWNTFVDDSIDFANVSKYQWTLYYCLGRLSVAVYFRQFEIAKKLVDVFPSLGLEGQFSVSTAMFMTGLQSAGQAHTSRDSKKHIRDLKATTQDMKKVIQTKTTGKMKHRLKILEVELMVAESSKKRQNKDIESAYDEAIASAVKAKYVNDAAVASEFAGEYFYRYEQTGLATKYLQQSIDFYGKWGATAKVQDVRGRHSRLFS